jgi:hypothetical protein
MASTSSSERLAKEKEEASGSPIIIQDDEACGPLVEAHKFFLANLPLHAKASDVRRHFEVS